MIRHLVDVNVLLALLWPRHESHHAAQAWFAGPGHRAWATNPLTQLGVLRLLTNPAVTQGAVSAITALNVLNEAVSHKGHEFWPLDKEFQAKFKSLSGRITGHQQWMDALLLWHATQHDGVLVTFDAPLKALAGAEFSNHILVLKSR